MMEGIHRIPHSCFTISTFPGDNTIRQPSTAVHILSAQHFGYHLSTGARARNIPRNNKEDVDFSTTFIHTCNYNFSTVWKTVVDNVNRLWIKRVES